MQKHIVNEFLKSTNVTDNNKNNLLNLVSKIQDRKTKDDYTQKIKSKDTHQKDSTLE